jgi:cytochrome c-type biogenesis protein CcmH
MSDNKLISLTAQQEARYKTLAEELRCLVCQNQTLADSNADLAVDLKNQVREQLAAGQSNDQIRAYLVARYGDFVLYKPPIQNNTLLLWGGPFALLGVAALIGWRVQRASQQAAQDKSSGPIQQSPVNPSKISEARAKLEARD